MNAAQSAALIGAAVALFGVFIQAIVYAYREGRKEQRLTAVEDRIKGVPTLEAVLAALSANMDGLKQQLGDLKSDLKTDIGEINHVIRNHLMKRSTP